MRCVAVYGSKKEEDPSCPCFHSLPACFRYLESNAVDLVITDSLTFAKRLREQYPALAVRMVEGAQGDPIDRVEDRASPLVPRGIYILTFGRILRVFSDGREIKFKDEKVRETLAWMVDKNGALTSLTAMSSVIYPDIPVPLRMAKMKETVSQLQELLEEEEIHIILRKHSQYAIDKRAVKCDLYDFLAGDTRAVNRYSGEYLSGYGWASFLVTEGRSKRQGTKVTMQDIAEELGVTKVSVSKAINGQPGISDSLRRKILQTASHMRYVKAEWKETGEPKNFLFVTPKRFFLDSDNFYTEIYYSLTNILKGEDRSLDLIVVPRREEEDGTIPADMGEQYDGIFVGGEMQDGYVNNLAKCGLPLVLIDDRKAGLNADFVITDNFYLGYECAIYLIRKGHTQIGFVGSRKATSNIRDRYFGYVKAMEEYGLEVRPEWAITNQDASMHQYAIDIALPDNLPTAFICHCDTAAYFLFQTLQMKGVRVPEDVSLIGFDNTKMATSNRLLLTSVDISRFEFAKLAYETMNDRISYPERANVRRYIQNMVIERQSVKDLKQIQIQRCDGKLQGDG